MNRRLFVGCLATTLGVLIAGCSSGEVSDERIVNVVRVFWHEHSRYSVLVEKSKGVYSTVSFPSDLCGRNSDAALIVADVPANEMMWISAKIRRGSVNNPDPCIEKLELYIHSPKEVDGVAWNHGKFGSGRTSVIE